MSTAIEHRSGDTPAVRAAALTTPTPKVDVDAVVADLAARQHGVVSRRQLLHAGVAGHCIEHRMKTKALRPTHRGVYRVGPLAGRRAREMAAVLACGETAVLSHLDAAAVWGFCPAPPDDSPVHITVRRSIRAPGVRLHRARTLPADEITRLEGLPTTTAERTLLDVASAVGKRDIERAIARAMRQDVTDPERIERIAVRHPRHPGTRLLRALLAAWAGPAFTRSEAEERFLELVRKARLGSPATNTVVLGHEVDFLWRAERLVVEIDGFAFHASRRAFEADRRRDADLTAAGLRVLRVTWRQLTKEPEAIVARVAQALARSGRS